MTEIAEFLKHYAKIKNLKKNPDRQAAFDELLNNEEIWVLAGSHYDREAKS